MSMERWTIGIVGATWSLALPRMQPASGGPGPFRVGVADPAREPDFLVHFGDVTEPMETRVPRARRVIVITEPPGVLTYESGFLDQFGIVITPFPLGRFGGRIIQSQPGLAWFYGCTFGANQPTVMRYSFEELLAMPPPPKTNAISAVLSRKVLAPLHVARVKCVEAVAARFPGHVRIFGSGFEPVADKAEAIDPYRFHFSLENTRGTLYWSEKIADAYLGWAMPVYDGCTTITDSFPAASLARIDVNDPEEAIRCVGELLEAGEKAVSIDAMAEARRRLLTEHSAPAMLQRALAPFAADVMALSKEPPVTLRPNAAFSLRGRLKSVLRKIRGGA